MMKLYLAILFVLSVLAGNSRAEEVRTADGDVKLVIAHMKSLNEDHLNISHESGIQAKGRLTATKRGEDVLIINSDLLMGTTRCLGEFRFKVLKESGVEVTRKVTCPRQVPFAAYGPDEAASELAKSVVFFFLSQIRAKQTNI
jgi:hypothetical protein